MKGTLLVKNVKHLVTCDGDDRLPDGAGVLIRDGVIGGIGQETAEDVIDASNMVMYPGLINTHHHLYQTFSRNLPQVQNKDISVIPVHKGPRLPQGSFLARSEESWFPCFFTVFSNLLKVG